MTKPKLLLAGCEAMDVDIIRRRVEKRRNRFTIEWFRVTRNEKSSRLYTIADVRYCSRYSIDVRGSVYDRLKKEYLPLRYSRSRDAYYYHLISAKGKGKRWFIGELLAFTFRNIQGDDLGNFLVDYKDDDSKNVSLSNLSIGFKGKEKRKYSLNFKNRYSLEEKTETFVYRSPLEIEEDDLDLD